MDKGGHTKRQGVAEAPARGPRRPGRRGLWTMIAFCFLIFVVVVVAETQNELARQAGQTPPNANAPAMTEADAAKADLEPVSLQRRLKEYYRAHDLPVGWVVTGIDAPQDDAGTVRIVFSPSPTDRRYGQPAPADDLDHGPFCPTPPEFWQAANGAAIKVELGDKTGVIETMTCVAVTSRQ